MIEDKELINVYGARVHNLKDIDVEIPRNSLTVITDLAVAVNLHWHLILSLLRDNADT